jgi:hypothetical protein
MRNLRQQFGAFVLAGVMAAVMFGTTRPAYAATADGMIGNKNACAFIEGILINIPEGVPGTTVAVGLGKLALLYACGA